MSLYDITAKVDTGAYSSALHCNYIDIDHRKKSVRFSPLNSKRIYQYPLIKMKNVKSSQGNKQHRAFIKLRVLINDQEYDTIFSLTTRHEMRSAVLLGRKTLVDRFIVDVSLYK